MRLLLMLLAFSSSGFAQTATWSRAISAGIQPSASSAATFIVCWPRAAIQIGSPGTGGWPRRSGRAAGTSSSGTGRPSSSARTLVTTSRSRAAGRSNGMSWKPSASARVLAPRPST